MDDSWWGGILIVWCLIGLPLAQWRDVKAPNFNTKNNKLFVVFIAGLVVIYAARELLR